MSDWNDFLGLADRLAAATEDKVASRSAISRAYYAAYHGAADVDRVSGLPSSGQSHLRVWAALAAAPDPDQREVGDRAPASSGSGWTRTIARRFLESLNLSRASQAHEYEPWSS